MNVASLGVLVLALSICVASPGSAQQAPPASEASKKVEALVTKAAALVDSKGRAAFEEFRKREASGFTMTLTFFPTI